MQFNLPPQVRAGLYILTAVGTPIIAYLFAKDVIGTLETTLWSSLVTVVSALAAFNVVTK